MFYPLELFMGLRYTRATRRRGHISIFSFISIVGIAIGVIVLITVLSVMNGFQKEMRERILGMASHATIMSWQGGLQDWPAAIEHANKHPEVTGAAPYIEGQVMLNQGRQVSGAIIRGVMPDYERQVSQVAERIKDGSFSDLQAGSYNIVLGKELALVMGVAVGDSITVITPQANSTPVGILPRLKRFTVVGIFAFDMQEYDRGMAFMHMVDAGKLLRMRDGITGVRLKLTDMDRAYQVATELSNGMDDYYRVSDWTRTHSNFFRAVKMEKRVLFIIMTLMYAVVFFNIVAMLVMVVTDKQADIAILRTLGMSPAAIMKVFMIQGTVIGLFGALFGVILGVLLASNVETIVVAIESIFQIKFLSPDIYYISDLPSDVHWQDVTIVGGVSFLLAIVATVYPAWKAANVHPAEALRYE